MLTFLETDSHTDQVCPTSYLLGVLYDNAISVCMTMTMAFFSSYQQPSKDKPKALPS